MSEAPSWSEEIVRRLAADDVSEHLGQAAAACEPGPLQEAILDLMHRRTVALVGDLPGIITMFVGEPPDEKSPPEIGGPFTE